MIENDGCQSVTQAAGVKILLETDQELWFDEAGCRIDGRDSFQGAAVEYRKSCTRKRFEVCHEAVEDNLTALKWHKNANLPGFPLSWKEAYDFIKNMSISGLSGITSWRLPTRRELFSLVSHRQINPALPEGHPFEDVFNGYYWTQTECARLPEQAWYIHLGGARVYRGAKQGSCMVWPVAAPQPDDRQMPNRFVIKNHTAWDGLTKRVWLRSSGAGGRPVKWEKALETIDVLNAQNAGGFADWRLPNIRELESLVDLNRHSPALAPEHPFKHVADGYWSSTTSIYEKRYAWVLYPRDGAVGVGYKPLPEFWVWAVRCDNHLI